MNKKLTQGQRIIAAIMYVITIVIVYGVLGGSVIDILNQTEQASVWFFSGILLVIMGKYVTEPYFSSPTDTFSNSISLILMLQTVADKSKLVGYYFLYVYAVLMFGLSLTHIVFKNVNERFKRISFFVLKNIGTSKMMFSAVYLFSAYSYFKDNMSMLIFAIALWICLIFFDVYEMLIRKMQELVKIIKVKQIDVIGMAVKNDNDSIIHVEVSKKREDVNEIFNSKNRIFAIKTANDIYELAICVDTKMLLESIWIELLILTDEEGHLTFQTNEAGLLGLYGIGGEEIGTTYSIEEKNVDTEWRKRIDNTYEIINKNRFIGFVLPDSNINNIKFGVCRAEDGRLTEGAIIETKVNGKRVLYQVINGITREEDNRVNSSDGFICGVARKLGTYDYEKSELKVSKWTPKTHEPVYLCETSRTTDFQKIADTAIGHLPLSEMKIPIKDINSLVTHNTAVLGILGVGKSCLTFELIKKIVDAGIKVICIDITNQYASDVGLNPYVGVSKIQNDLKEEALDKLKATALLQGNAENPGSWGNLKVYSETLEKYMVSFLGCGNKNVFVLNPDKHTVKKADKNFKIMDSVDVSLVEKIKIISEVLLKVCSEMGQIDRARCCLVFEEAHSLTPEWNSVVNSGDERHSNGTAKVILQGRKYGLGCILVTQRTANVIKSILNQCNTIFALRVFDDTGKSFLENYIGKDYSDVLPTLEERHAIVMGKGLELKQPVIVQLNDAKYVRKELPV